MTISTVDSGPHKVARAADVPAPVDELFDLVADPRRHHELDGSGTVLDTVSGPPRLSEGATFSVRMKQYGVPYRITSKVTGFVDGTVIEWRHPLGHRWRWEFSPVSPAMTRVTETFDYSWAGAGSRLYELLGFARKNGAGIEATLRNLASRYRK